MIRSLLWKDTREHLGTVLILCLGGIGLMAGVGALIGLEGYSPMRTAQATGLCILLLAPGISLLLGSLILGSDRENGVEGWLNSLPEPGWKIWLARNLFAVISQLGLVACWGIFWLVFYAPVEKLLEPGMVVFLLVASLMGIAWGQWGMDRSRTVFGGFGNGLLGLVAAVLVIYSALVILSYLLLAAGKGFGFGDPFGDISDVVFISGFVLIVFVPFVWVFLNHCREWSMASWSKVPLLTTTLHLWWLSVQSHSRPFLIMGAIGLVLGFMLSESFLIWPIWSLSMGVVSGLCVLSQDQSGSRQLHGSLRAFRPYLLDLRAIPAFLLGMIINLVPFLPLGIVGIYRGIVSQGSSDQILELVWPGVGMFAPFGPYVFLWWCAGFGAALWCSFFLEKPVVAFVVSWGLGGSISVIWIPALLGGGLSVLWPLGLVVVFWFLGRFLYRGFVSENLSTSGPKLFGLMVVCLGIFCGLGILARLYPPRGLSEDPFSLAEIKNALKNENPKLEDEVRRHLVDNRRGIKPVSAIPSLPENPATLLNTPVSGWPEKVIHFLKEIAPKNSQELAGEWKVPEELITFFGANQTDRLLSEPASLFGECQNINSQMQSRGILSLWEVSKGAKGSEERFANEIDRILYVGECLRHKSHFINFNFGESLERFAYQMIDYHLAQDKPTEAGLAYLASVLEKVGVRSKQVKPMTREVGYWISRKSNENPSVWRKTYSPLPTAAGRPWLDAYWQFVDLALSAPWEKERSRRMINHWFSTNPPTDRFGPRENYDYQLDLIPYWHFNTWNSMSPNKQLSIEERGQMTAAIHDIAQTAVALKRFRIAKGAWPKTLSELSPVYLKVVPKDPYSQADFGFRIFEAAKPSKIVPGEPGSDGPAGAGGEEGKPGVAAAMTPGDAAGMGAFPDSLLLPGLGEKEIPVVTGTLILWSIGPDKTEEGNLKSNFSGTAPGRAHHSGLVFLIAP